MSLFLEFESLFIHMLLTCFTATHIFVIKLCTMLYNRRYRGDIGG